jgi:hypothetical protein
MDALRERRSGMYAAINGGSRRDATDSKNYSTLGSHLRGDADIMFFAVFEYQRF